MIMKKFFTLTRLLFAVGIVFFGTQAYAQVDVNVDGLGSYRAELANFGVNNPCDLGEITGNLRLINDGSVERWGCESYVDANIAGKIAVLYRGGTDCGFALKAANAEANGAVAVVICNNVPGRRPMGPTQGINVSIPAVLISLEDCFNLRQALDASEELNGSIDYTGEILDPAITIAWGDAPDEGQFAGGLNGWTVENCSVGNVDNPSVDPPTWAWVENPIEQRFSSQMVSYSRCNGAAGIDVTDWNITYGDLSNPNNYPDHHCELISPVIDLSDYGPVSLQFWQINFSLNGNDSPADPVSRFFISYDGGVTWPDVEYADSGNRLTADETTWANGEFRRYFLPQLAGESNIRLKFEFHGDFYAWYIDDVIFIETPANSLTIDEEWYSLPSSYQTPVDLVEPITPIGAASNTGLTTQPNTQITVNFNGPTTGSATISLGDLERDSSRLACATSTFLPSAAGRYTVDMEVQSDSVDFDPNDNSFQYDFFVTDSVWSKGGNGVSGAARPGGDDNNFVWGSIFRVPETVAQNVPIYGLEFGFELVDSVNQQFIQLEVYEWDDLNNDNLVGQDERTLLSDMDGFPAQSFIEFDYRDGVDGEINTIDLTDQDDDFEDFGQLEFEPGKSYVAVLNWSSTVNELNMYGFNGLNYDGLLESSITCANNPRPVGTVSVGSDVNGDWTSGGWTSGIVSSMKLITKPFTTNINENTIEQEHEITMFPNPAKNDVFVDYTFESTVNELEISLMDMAGKVFATRTLNNTRTKVAHFDVTDLPTGVYFAKITTEEGIATRKFVVAK